MRYLKYFLILSLLLPNVVMAAAVKAALKLPVVTAKLEAGCDAKRKSITTSSFSLLVDGKKYGKVAANVCFSNKVKVLSLNKKGAYVTFLPSGLKGYRPYATYRNLFYVNFKTKKISRVESVKADTDIFVNEAQTRAAFIIETEKKPRLVIRNLVSGKEQIFELPKKKDNARWGGFKFSPDLGKLAVSLGLKEKKESGEVHVLDIAKKKFSLHKKTAKAPKVEWTGKGLQIK